MSLCGCLAFACFREICTMCTALSVTSNNDPRGIHCLEAVNLVDQRHPPTKWANLYICFDSTLSSSYKHADEACRSRTCFVCERVRACCLQWKEMKKCFNLIVKQASMQCNHMNYATGGKVRRVDVILTKKSKKIWCRVIQEDIGRLISFSWGYDSRGMEIISFFPWASHGLGRNCTPDPVSNLEDWRDIRHVWCSRVIFNKEVLIVTGSPIALASSNFCIQVKRNNVQSILLTRLLNVDSIWSFLANWHCEALKPLTISLGVWSILWQCGSRGKNNKRWLLRNIHERFWSLEEHNKILTNKFLPPSDTDKESSHTLRRLKIPPCSWGQLLYYHLSCCSPLHDGENVWFPQIGSHIERKIALEQSASCYLTLQLFITVGSPFGLS